MNVVEHARHVMREYDRLDRPMKGRFIYLTDCQINELVDYRPIQTRDIQEVYGMEIRRYGT